MKKSICQYFSKCTLKSRKLLTAQKLVAELEGNFICPEGAATFAAAEKLRKEGWIKEEEVVVCLNTGAGIKYPETVELANIPTLQPGEFIER